MLSEMAMAAMGQACGSTSTLIGALFLGMSDGVETSELDARATADMFASGLANVQRQTKAGVGDRTMMDALIPAVEALQAHCADGLQPMFAAAAAAAAEGAEQTKDLVAQFGRAVIWATAFSVTWMPVPRRWPASSTPLPTVAQTINTVNQFH